MQKTTLWFYEFQAIGGEVTMKCSQQEVIPSARAWEQVDVEHSPFPRRLIDAKIVNHSVIQIGRKAFVIMDREWPQAAIEIYIASIEQWKKKLYKNIQICDKYIKQMNNIRQSTINKV